MKIAILGYGSQGKSALEYWSKGNDITICDFDETIEVPHGVSKKTGAHYLADLHHFDLIVRSPAVHPRDVVAANDERILRRVTTVTEEFFRNCNATIIGVTGTKGKGTTSSLITEVLKGAGKTVYLGGNIGIPPLDLLKENIQENDYVVLELANFQLIDLRVSPPIAVCLMVVPEHLNWHANMAEYVAAKQNIFRYQDDEDLAIYNRLNDFSGEVASVSPALKVSYEVPEKGQEPSEKNGAYVSGEDIFYDDEKICSTTDVALIGRHNLQNVCAAIAATWNIVDHDKDVIIRALQSFTGMPYRLEFIRELSGVKYYNDSFGTTPDTAIAALDSFDQPKVIILGGSDKGVDYESLGQQIPKKNVRTVVLIGETAPKIRAALEKNGFTHITEGGNNMEEIVAAAHSAAQEGDVVLLSTASASFDMFSNYKDRGDQFNQAVQALG